MTTKPPNRPSDEAVEAATGRGWAEWFDLLREAGAEDMEHRAIAKLLVDKGYLEPDQSWWAQTVTVAYEHEEGRRVVGETKASGFQVGVQRTLHAPAGTIWDLVTSSEGVRTWSGADLGDLTLEEGAVLEAEDGTRVEVRTFVPGERLRLRWQPPGRDEPTTLQLTCVDKGDRTAVRVHLEHLRDPAERQEMKMRWREVLEALRELVEPS